MKVGSGRIARSKLAGAKFSTAIDAAGHGKFQYIAFLTAGLIYFTSGLQSGINAYILPSVKCAFQLTDSQMGVLNALFLGGGGLAAHLWGALSDSYGRRPVLAGSFLLDAMCTVVAALAPNYTVFAVVRLFSGMLNMAPAGLSYLYLGEFVGAKKRTAFTQAIGSAWIASWIVLPGLAWVVIPQPWSVDLLGINLQSWRFFLGMLLVPSLASAALALYMPETPKFLQAAGREEDALRVYRRIYVTNTGSSADSYPVKRLHLPVVDAAKTAEDLDHGHAAATHGKGVLHILARTLRVSLELFRPPVLYRTVLCCLVYFFSMFVMYGFGYWLPELLNRYGLYATNHPGEREYVCAAIAREANAANSTLLSAPSEAAADVNCGDASVVDPSAFVNTAIVNCGSLIVNLFCAAFVTSFIGRRTLAAGSNLLAGVTGFGLLYASSTVELVVVAIFFNAMAETGCVGINGMLVDIFPPRISGVGVATVMLSGRLGGSVGNLAIGYLLEQGCELPLLLLFGTAIVCGLLCCFAHRRYVEDDDKDANADAEGQAQQGQQGQEAQPAAEQSAGPKGGVIATGKGIEPAMTPESA